MRHVAHGRPMLIGHNPQAMSLQEGILYVAWASLCAAIVFAFASSTTRCIRDRSCSAFSTCTSTTGEPDTLLRCINKRNQHCCCFIMVPLFQSYVLPRHSRERTVQGTPASDRFAGTASDRFAGTASDRFAEAAFGQIR